MKKVFATLALLLMIPFISHAKEDSTKTQQFQIHFIGSVNAAPCNVNITQANITTIDTNSHNVQLSACDLNSPQSTTKSNINAANIQKQILDSLVLYTVSYK